MFIVLKFWKVLINFIQFEGSSLSAYQPFSSVSFSYSFAEVVFKVTTAMEKYVNVNMFKGKVIGNKVRLTVQIGEMIWVQLWNLTNVLEFMLQLFEVFLVTVWIIGAN